METFVRRETRPVNPEQRVYRMHHDRSMKISVCTDLIRNTMMRDVANIALPRYIACCPNYHDHKRWSNQAAYPAPTGVAAGRSDTPGYSFGCSQLIPGYGE